MVERNDNLSLDRGFYLEPRCVALRERFGNDGFAFYYFILSMMCYSDDFLFPVTDQTSEIISEQMGISLERYFEILEYCFELDLFEKEIYDNERVLVSTEYESVNVSYL